MSTFYHVTMRSCLPCIMRDGLKPRIPDEPYDYQPAAVYMWRHKGSALAMQQPYGDAAVMLEVTMLDCLVTEDWEMDSDEDGDSNAVKTSRWIPPSAIHIA
jgi:hypothetical protein